MRAADFKALAPRDRGYFVYMLGSREDEPHVPDERNPFPKGSEAFGAWEDGQRRAAVEAQDFEE